MQYEARCLVSFSPTTYLVLPADLDLAAHQLDAAFDFLLELILVVCLFVGRDAAKSCCWAIDVALSCCWCC